MSSLRLSLCCGRAWRRAAAKAGTDGSWLDVGNSSPNLRDIKKVSLPSNEVPLHPNNTMASSKPSTKGKGAKGKSGNSSRKGSASKSKPTGSAPEGISKRKQKSLSLAKPGGAQKSKSLTSKFSINKKKKRVYTEKELNIPTLNSIIPAGIAKPKGQKKGKKFVDDSASMMAIMSVVHAEKEGHLESKIMRARQLEEIREAKRKEAEERSDDKKAQFVSLSSLGTFLQSYLRFPNAYLGTKETRSKEETKATFRAVGKHRK